MNRIFRIFMILGVAVAITGPNAAVAELSKTDTKVCKDWYEGIREKGREACFYVARDVEWTWATFRLPEK